MPTRSISTIDIHAYDKDENFIPNNQQLHGSARYELKTISEKWTDHSMFKQDMEITRTKWKSLNEKSEICSLEQQNQDTEKCVTR